jgi:outer membrane protein assembly factor BamE (lipoprotein component of BamABCDE complex)
MMRVAWILMVGLLMPCSGCILIPTPEYKSDGIATRQNISDKEVDMIQVNTTTREQILLRFGQPDATFDEQRRFVYLWAHVTAWIAAGGGYSAAMAEIAKGYVLEINFRPDGVVSAREIRTVGLGDVFKAKVISGIGYAPQRER